MNIAEQFCLVCQQPAQVCSCVPTQKNWVSYSERPKDAPPTVEPPSGHDFQEGTCINCGCSTTNVKGKPQEIPVECTEADRASYRNFRDYLETNKERISARRHAIEVAGKFARLFTGNPNAYGLRYEDDRYETIQRNANGAWETPTEGRIPRSHPWPQAWERHLRGEYPSLLSIPIIPSGNVYFAALKIDRQEGSHLPPLDCATLATEVASLGLPLVCWRAGNGRGGYLGIFVGDQDGCNATIVNKALEHYRAVLKVEGAEDPDFNAGTDLPYFGSDRVAFGEAGEKLTVEQFLDLAKKRTAYAAKLSKCGNDWLTEAIERMFDPAKEAEEALGLVKKELEGQWVVKEAQKKEEFLQHVLKISRFEVEALYKPIATKLGISVPTLKAKLVEMRDVAKAPQEVPSDAIIYSLKNYATCLREAEKVLANIPGRYYECDRRLVIPVHARESENKSVERDEASVVIDAGSTKTVRRDLIDNAHFFEEVGGVEGKLVPIFPPPDILGDIFDRLQSEVNQVPYIHLDMLVATPTLLPSGGVHDAPGELREGVLFLAPTYDYPKVPDNPTREDGIAALKKFEPIFCKFPFIGGTDKEGQPLPWNQTTSYSCLLAGGFSLVVRSALRPSDAIPITVYNGPKQRSGKTLLVEATTLAVLSHNPTPVHFHDEAEFGKTLLPVIQQQDRAVLIDNVERTVRSAKLAMLVTGNRLRDRILGLSETVDLHNRSVFFTTGNNLSLAGDLASRAVQVSIDPGVERPEERTFDFDPRERAREHHPELVIALLTALRAYILAGKPWLPQREPWGGFAAWDQLVCGCLVWLGYADPFTTRADVLAEDPERTENMDILEAWFDEFQDRPIAVSEISKNPTTEIHRVLSKDGLWNPEWVGWRLSRLRNRVEGGKKLVRVGDSKGSSRKRLWRVVEVGAASSAVQEVGRGQSQFF